MSQREAIHRTEKDLTIERSDQEYLALLNFLTEQLPSKINKEINEKSPSEVAKAVKKDNAPVKSKPVAKIQKKL